MSKKNDAASSWRSLVVLCASLVLVYTVFFWYQQPIDPLLQATAGTESFEPAPWAESEDEQPVDNVVEPPAEESTQIAQVKVADDSAEANEALPVVDDTPTPTPTSVSVEGKQFHSFQELFDQGSSPSITQQIPLSNTYVWTWNLRSIVDFGMNDQVEYILKTVQNTHYVYLWKRDLVEIPKILEMGWTVVEIEGKNAINQHSLFGDRVMLINTERYDVTFQKVIFIVFFEQTRDAWFVQVDQDYYENHADDIRKLFDQRYDR